jgi:hypothetical protein
MKRSPTLVLLVLTATAAVGCGANNDTPAMSTPIPETGPITEPTTTTPAPPTTVATTGAPQPTMTAPPTTLDPATQPPFGPCTVDVDCVAEVVLSLRDGRIVSYDRDVNELTVWEATPRTFAVGAPGDAVTIDPETLPTLGPVLAGPAGVVYATVDAGTGDPVGRLLAISTDPANAGSVLAEATELIDLSGDSDLVATPSGVAWVSCCAFDVRRPVAGDAQLLMGWVGSDGDAIVDDAPEIWVEYRDDGSMDVVRLAAGVETRWNLASVPMPRGMPLLVPLADGGMVVDVTDYFAGTPSRVVRGFPDGSLVETSIDGATIEAVRPDGSMIAFAGGWALFPPLQL